MGKTFDDQSARRIAAAVTAFERARGDRTNAGGFQSVAHAETIFAKLTEAVDDKFRWEEVYPLDDGTWEAVPEGRSSGDDDESLAFDLVAGTSSVNADPVILKRSAVAGDDDEWMTGWVIVPKPPTAIRVKCVDDYSHANGYVSVKKWNGVSVTGDPFDVDVAYHTSNNDVFYILPAPEMNSGYIQLGLPPIRSVGMVLQVMPGIGGPHAIDWDFLKGHA